MLQQRRHGLHAPGRRREVEGRGATVGGPATRIRTGAQQDRHDRGVTTLAGQMERPVVAEAGHGLHVRPGVEEERRQLRVAALRCPMERRHAVALGGINVFARRLTSEVSRSSDLVREICASIINQNTTHTFTGASWAIKESWAAVASLSFEQKGLMQEVLERAADGSLNPEWTAEHVPYFGKSETEAGDKIHLKVTTTMVEEKLVDSVSLMAGIGIGVIVGVVGTILFRKFNN